MHKYALTVRWGWVELGMGMGWCGVVWTGTPYGYRHMNGYSSHTYKWVNAAGEQFYVKMHFKTEAGVKNMTGVVLSPPSGAYMMHSWTSLQLPTDKQHMETRTHSAHFSQYCLANSCESTVSTPFSVVTPFSVGTRFR